MNDKIAEAQPPPSVPLLQVFQLPEQGRIGVQFGPAVTDPLMCMMNVAKALVQMAEQGLANERQEHRSPGKQVLRAGPGMRVPRVD